MRALLCLLLFAGHARAESWLELQLIPVSAQVNVLEAEHAGSGGRITFHFNRFIGVYVGGLYNWLNQPSTALDAIHEFQRIDIYWGEPVLATWQVHGGLESIPLTGTFALGTREGTVGLVLTAGLGPGGSRVRLGEGAPRPSSADAGVRLMGHFGGGFRFALGAFALHAGVHASMWSSLLTQLNGCSWDELHAMDGAIRSGRDPYAVLVSPTCRGFPSSNDIPLAMTTIRFPDPSTRVNVAAELGLSWSL